MGKRRRKYKRRSEPGWYKDQKGKRYAVRVTVLSLLAMLLLVIAVPVIFWAGGGYDAMAGDTVVKSFTTAGDFDREGMSWWTRGAEYDVQKGYLDDQEVRAGLPVAGGDWFYPKEQNETFSSMVIECGAADCSGTDGGFLFFGFYQNISISTMLDKNAAYLKVRVRLSIAGSFHLESRNFDGDPTGFWLDVSQEGVRPDMFKAKGDEVFALAADNWTEVNYPVSRAELLMVSSTLSPSTGDRFAIALNLTNASLSPVDMDGEVLDWELAWYSAGGGVKMAGELFGWSVGMLLMVCAAASTPYWNPTREKTRRKWRRSRRWYR